MNHLAFYGLAMVLIIMAQIAVAQTKSFAANVAVPIALLIALLLYLAY